METTMVSRTWRADGREADSRRRRERPDAVEVSMRASKFILASAISLIAAACSGDASEGPTASESTSPSFTSADTTTIPSVTTVPPATLPEEGFPQGESALDDMRAESFPDPLVPPEEIISGGPPPDGIPPIDEPEFVSVEAADEWLEDEEPVVVLEVGSEARAYPVQILIWHEIVNDTVDGVPVSVTYCPLCNSAISYVREIEGEETTFGTSGRLFASALVMYDRATESLWTHFDGRAVVGLMTGHRLEPIASPLLAWADFKSAHPDGLVLDIDATGHSRPYGSNPYQGYDNPDEFPFLFRGTLDDRSRAMQRVVGVRRGESARAWTLEAIAGDQAAATNSTVGDVPVIVFWAEGQSSALESGTIAAGRDVGSVGVFSPVLDGETLTFSVVDGSFTDDQTGSVWSITGQATSGELSGTQLERIPHLDTFWFAWSTYAPGTDLVEQS
jgi:hypothetical protein